MPPTSKQFLKRNKVGCMCANEYPICELYTYPEYDSMCDHLGICSVCGHKPERHIGYKKKEYQPDIAIHPSVTVREYLEVLKISQGEFAKKIGLPRQYVCELLNEKRQWNENVCYKMAQCLGVSDGFIWNLWTNYLWTKYLNGVAK